MSFQSERTCTSGRSRRQLTWFDRSGKSLGVFGAPDDTQNALSLSADGRLAAVVRTVAGNTDVWLIDGTRTSRFTFADATDAYPAWSPDSRQIAFSSNRTGAFNPWVTSSSGAGEERQLLQSPQTSRPTDWSKDGRFLATVMVDSGTNTDLWAVPMMGEQRPFVSMTLLDGAPVLASPARLFQTRIFGSGRYEDGQYWNYAVAPDGRFLLNTLLDGEGSPGPLTLIQHWTPATR